VVVVCALARPAAIPQNAARLRSAEECIFIRTSLWWKTRVKVKAYPLRDENHEDEIH
jgi:hypothetical protein